jgi:hypothetical protein
VEAATLERWWCGNHDDLRQHDCFLEEGGGGEPPRITWYGMMKPHLTHNPLGLLGSALRGLFLPLPIM